MKVRTLSMMALGGSFALGAPALAGSDTGDVVSGEFVGRGFIADIAGFGAANVWRVYANVGAGNQVTAVFGDMANPLSITSSTGAFYQDALGADNEPSQAFVDLFPDLGNDSYVTIGNAAVDAGETATGLSPFFPGGSAADPPWGTGALETMNGSWFRTPDDTLTNADGDGLVLIGQFTVAAGARVDGIINLATVIGGQSGTGEGLEFNFVVPSPGALALLGLAGLAGTRRRRA